MGNQDRVPEYLTRAGLSPSQRELPFEITTTKAEEYIQNKLDVIMKKISTNGEAVPHIDIQLYNTDAGRSFLPFIVVLPLDVLEGDVKDQSNNNGQYDIFNPNRGNQRNARMKEVFMRFFTPYMFNKADRNAFFSDDWRRRCGVNRNTATKLAQLITPTISVLEHGKCQYVTFLLDPIRVFHDMLKMESNKSDFFVQINSWKKTSTGIYCFYIDRVTRNNRGNKRYNETMIDELNARIRRGN